MGPTVGTVVVHEDRDIADDADGPLGAVTAQRPPLLIKSELQCASNPKVVRQFCTRFFQGDGLTVREIMRPLIPPDKFLPRAQSIKEGKVVEPPRILSAEAVKALLGDART